MQRMKFLSGLMVVALAWTIGCKEDETKVTVTTDEVTNISTTTATAGGTVTADGGTVTERGVVWSQNPGPTTAGTKANDGAGGIGSFSINLTGLSNATTYHLRAYAINGGQTSYGGEVIFSTADPIELIGNGDFTVPAVGDGTLASAEPWKTEESDAGIIGHDPAEYKGKAGYVWTQDWSKSFYQTVGTVPAVETEYSIHFDYTCTWNAWGDYKPVTSVIFSAYDQSADPSTRQVIGKVDIEASAFYPGWDQNTWESRNGSFILTEAQATQFAGKNLVIEFDVIHYDDGQFFSDVWYNFDNVSVKQL